MFDLVHKISIVVDLLKTDGQVRQISMALHHCSHDLVVGAASFLYWMGSQLHREITALCITVFCLF
jgi:hypothetical protein